VGPEFLAGVGGKLAERWVAVVLTPAFVFWAAGLLAWVDRRGWSDGWRDIGEWIAALSSAEQLALLVGTLLGVTISGVIVQRLTRPLIRALEGYGWPAFLRRRLVERRAERIERDERRHQELAGELAEGTTTHASEYSELDTRLRRVPTDPADRMPTRVGNILRAAERWPLQKYGLDPVKCWTALWLALPQDARTELGEARGQLDGAVAALAWALLACVWVVWAWWALPAGLIVAAAIHRGWVRSSAEGYGAMLESTFDVHRWRLYDALHLEPPSSAADERAHGEALTDYLWRGSDLETVVYVAPPAAG
jgi:hypothetical protein